MQANAKDILDLIKSLGIFTVGSLSIAAAIAFVAKAVFTQWLSNKASNYKLKLDKDVELYKAGIQKEAELYKADIQKDAELYKAQLQKEASEHQIRYSKLHNDRAERISDLYEKIVKMESNMRSLFNVFQMAGDPPKREKLEVSAKSFEEAMQFYNVNRIYFNEDTCTIIDKIAEEVLDNWNEFLGYELHLDQLSEFPEERREQVEVWRRCWNAIKNNLPELKRELENDFRKQLGVE